MYSVEYTCTSSEIVVTTNSIITVRPSTWMPTSMRPPLAALAFHQLTACSIGSRIFPGPWSRSIHCTTEMQAMTKDDATARTPISDPFRGSRFPTTRMAKNDTAGTRGIR